MYIRKNIKKIYFVFFAIILVICVVRPGSFAAETKQENEPGKIAFCQHDGRYWQVWIMDLDGSNKKELTNSEFDKRSPSLSSDGRRIVYVTNDGKLWVMDSTGDNKTHIPLNISATEPKWCFQDKSIVFTSYRGMSFLDDSDIWILNSDGSDLKKITRRPSLQFLPDISEDGKELLFVDVLESAGHEIFKFNLETKDYTQLTDNRYHDTAPAFTADGSMIVYSADKDDSYDIWIMDKYGQNQKNLTQSRAFDSCPVITKDGKTIFFLSDSTKIMQIWSMDVDGKSVKQITDDGYDKQDISVYTP
jgi:TolB protein